MIQNDYGILEVEAALLYYINRLEDFLLRRIAKTTKYGNVKETAARSMQKEIIHGYRKIKNLNIDNYFTLSLKEISREVKDVKVDILSQNFQTFTIINQLFIIIDKEIKNFSNNLERQSPLGLTSLIKGELWNIFKNLERTCANIRSEIHPNWMNIWCSSRTISFMEKIEELNFKKNDCMTCALWNKQTSISIINWEECVFQKITLNMGMREQSIFYLFESRRVHTHKVAMENIIGIGFHFSNNKYSLSSLFREIEFIGNIKIIKGVFKNNCVREVIPLVLHINNNLFQLSWELFNNNPLLRDSNLKTIKRISKHYIEENTFHAQEFIEIIEFIDKLNSACEFLLQSGQEILYEIKNFILWCIRENALNLSNAKKIEIIFIYIIKAVFLINASAHGWHSGFMRSVQLLKESGLNNLFLIEKKNFIDLNIKELRCIFFENYVEEQVCQRIIDELFFGGNHSIITMRKIEGKHLASLVKLILWSPVSFWKYHFASQNAEGLGSVYFAGGRVRIFHNGGPQINVLFEEYGSFRVCFLTDEASVQYFHDFLSENKNVLITHTEVSRVLKQCRVFEFEDKYKNKKWRLVEIFFENKKITDFHISRGSPSMGIKLTCNDIQRLYVQAYEIGHLLYYVDLKVRKKLIKKANQIMQNLLNKIIEKNKQINSGEENFIIFNKQEIDLPMLTKESFLKYQGYAAFQKIPFSYVG